MRQIPLAIGPGPLQSFGNFLPGGNAGALAHLMAIAPGAPPVYLWGPAGSGKSHLLHAVELQARLQGAQVAWFSATNAAPWPADDEPDWLVFDDCHDFDEAQQHAAFALFVDATSRGAAVLAAGSVPPVDLAVREDLRTRLGWGHVFALVPLGEAEVRATLRSEADRRGTFLSDEVTGYLLTRYTRDLKHLMAQLDRLDAFSLSTHRAITVPLLKQMLADESGRETSRPGAGPLPSPAGLPRGAAQVRSDKRGGSVDLALFDLDHTLLPIDSDHAWGEFMQRLGWVEFEAFRRGNDAFYAQYQAGRLDIEAYIAFAAAPLQRRSPAELAAGHARFMREVIVPAIQPQARALVEHHRAQGNLLALVTSTNDFVVAPIAAAFAIETLIATRLERDAAGAFTGRIDGTPAFREGKVARVGQWLAGRGAGWGDFDRISVYSDSPNDLPLLERATDPVATNPSPELEALARQRGWRVLRLFESSR